MLSRTQVINNALQMLGADQISDPSEQSESARQSSMVYDQCVREELMKQAWSFAKAQVRLPVSADAPTFRFARAFVLPADFIRLVELENRWVFSVQRTVDTNPIPAFERQGRTIFTDLGAPLGITYIRDLSDDPTLWDPMFSAVVSSALALKLAMTLTKSEGTVSLVNKRYQQELKEAKRGNAIQLPPQLMPDGSWLTARFDGGGYGFGTTAGGAIVPTDIDAGSGGGGGGGGTGPVDPSDDYIGEF